jgi:hypothetical protein
MELQDKGLTAFEQSKYDPHTFRQFQRRYWFVRKGRQDRCLALPVCAAGSDFYIRQPLHVDNLITATALRGEAKTLRGAFNFVFKLAEPRNGVSRLSGTSLERQLS